MRMEKKQVQSFDSVKSFAQNMKCFNDLNIQYIEKQLGEKEESEEENYD